MEIVIAAVVVALGLAAGLVIAAGGLAKRAPGVATATPAAPPRPSVPPVVNPQKPVNSDDSRAAKRLLEKRLAEVNDRERRLGDRERAIEETREKAGRGLERASGLSASRASGLL